MGESNAPERGRGTGLNPQNRFVEVFVDSTSDLFSDSQNEPPPRTPTKYYVDHARSILTKNNSPDIPFDYSINPYRGCEHGCIYCYARPSHEFLGLSSGIDFETKIFIKEKAPELLAEELSSKHWKPQLVTMSGITDPYQPAEKKFQLTRRCLEVFARFLNPVGIITKNHAVTRDLDHLRVLAEARAVSVSISVTSLKDDVCAMLEPRTSRPKSRLQAIEELAKNGIPVGVMVATIVPGLTDEEVPAILKAAFEAGAQFAGHVPLRLPYAVKDLFMDWVRRTYPDRADKIINRIRGMRGGELNDSRFGERMQGEGPFAQQIHALFHATCKKIGFNGRFPELSTTSFRRVKEQLSLF